MTTPTPEALLTEACSDCLATVTATMDQGLNGPVPRVVVTHQSTCPWLARVAPDGSTLSCLHGILVHCTAEPEEAVGDVR